MHKQQRAPFGLRMPDDMKDWIGRRATAEGRSQNNLIVHLLRKEMATGEDYGRNTPAAGNDNAALPGGASITHGIGGAADD